MEPEEQEALARRVAAIDEELGAAVANPETTVEELASPLRQTRVFVAEQFLPTRPLLIYLNGMTSIISNLGKQRPAI